MWGDRAGRSSDTAEMWPVWKKKKKKHTPMILCSSSVTSAAVLTSQSVFAAWCGSRQWPSHLWWPQFDLCIVRCLHHCSRFKLCWNPETKWQNREWDGWITSSYADIKIAARLQTKINTHDEVWGNSTRNIICIARLLSQTRANQKLDTEYCSTQWPQRQNIKFICK